MENFVRFQITSIIGLSNYLSVEKGQRIALVEQAVENTQP